MSTPGRYATSCSLLRRAHEIMPGGHHLSGRPLLDPESSPMYFDRGQGSRIWDVDGNEYVDFIMAYGPFLLGYANPEVDRAAFKQAANGNLLSLNHPLHHQFLEAVLARFAGAEMGVFVKTGSEATTAAVRIARRATGRRLIARCGYHGWHDWCLPGEDFVPQGLSNQVFTYDASRPETLQALFDTVPEQFAAVILAPEMIYPPSIEKITVLMDTARAHGALFIMDEVKTGLRAPGGSMQSFYKVVPDMTTLSKALGNGWAIGAVIGPRAVMGHAAGMHLSATYHGDTAPMAAALATLAVIDRDDVQSHVSRLGERLIRGLNDAARRSGVPAQAYAEPISAMPFLRFDHSDPACNERLRNAVYGKAFEEGILLHPRHMWFLSAAHTEGQIDHAVEVVDRAMHQVAASQPDLMHS